MTESREELVAAIAQELSPFFANRYGADGWRVREAIRYASASLNALLAHPSAVLSELENAPCQTCRGVGERMVEALDPRKMDPYTIEAVGPCDACGGSGKLGVAGILSELENAPCQGCGGRGIWEADQGEGWETVYCTVCGGSGKLGREGVLRALGMEQVGRSAVDENGRVHGGCNGGATQAHRNCRPVFARVPVPEPSEGPAVPVEGEDAT